MYSLFRMDPGPCPICGCPHTACTGTGASLSTQLLPGRDALAAAAAKLAAPPAPVQQSFTTATYRRAQQGRRR